MWLKFTKHKQKSLETGKSNKLYSNNSSHFYFEIKIHYKFKFIYNMNQKKINILNFNVLDFIDLTCNKKERAPN